MTTKTFVWETGAVQIGVPEPTLRLYQARRSDNHKHEHSQIHVSNTIRHDRQRSSDQVWARSASVEHTYRMPQIGRGRPDSICGRQHRHTRAGQAAARCTGLVPASHPTQAQRTQGAGMVHLVAAACSGTAIGTAIGTASRGRRHDLAASTPNQAPMAPGCQCTSTSTVRST